MNTILISGGRLTSAGAKALEALVLEVGTDAPAEALRARIDAAGIEITPEPGREVVIEVRDVKPVNIPELAAVIVSGGELAPGSAERIAALVDDALAKRDDRFDRVIVLEPER